MVVSGRQGGEGRCGEITGSWGVHVRFNPSPTRNIQVLSACATLDFPQLLSRGCEWGVARGQA